MREDWIDNLKNELERKLSEFLEGNPYQQSLFLKQSQADAYQELSSKEEKLQQQAQILRSELLELAQKIQDWDTRTKRAKQANKQELSNRAEQHLAKLMEQGRKLWTELDQVGTQFKEVKRKMLELVKTTQNKDSSPEESWAIFETEEELDQLRKKIWSKESP